MGLLESLGLTSLASGSAPSSAAPPVGAAPGSAGAPPKPRPSDALDAKLGTELDALQAVVGDIHDDAAAAPLHASIQKVVDGRATAQDMAEPKRVTALSALIASVRKQRPAADAALKHDKAINSHETARKEVAVALDQVTALVLGGISDDSLRTTLNADLQKAKADFDKASNVADLARGEKAILAVKPAALALLARAERAKGATDWLTDVWKPLLEATKADVAVISTAAPKGDLTTQISTLEATVPPLVAASDLATLQGTTAPALRAIQAKAKAVVEFEKESAAIKVGFDAADAYYTGFSVNVPPMDGVNFVNAKSNVDGAVAAGDYAGAKAALAALKTTSAVIVKVRDQHQAYETAMAALQPDRAKIQALLGSAGLPPKATKDYETGFAPVNAAETNRNWVAALAAIPAYKKAIQAALDVIKDGKKFYSVYDSIRPEDERAAYLLFETNNDHQTDEKLSAAGSRYAHFREVMKKAVAASEWGDARDVLADLQVSAREFIAAAAANKAARAPYDAAWTGLRRRGDAQRVVNPLTAPYAAAAPAFIRQRQVVFAAVDSGDFAQAIAQLPALQTAIDALAVIVDAQKAAKTQFDAGYPPVGDKEARESAAAKVPALAEATNAFDVADKAVEAGRKIPDWVVAFAALPALTDATAKLAQARTDFNGAAKPEDAAAFDAKLAALQPRTGKATDATIAPFIDVLQKAVVKRLADISAALAKAPKDLATAEAGYTQLLGDLDRMEAGKAKLAAHTVRFTAIKNGDIAKALAVPLTPPALIAERAAAVGKTEAAIVTLAGTGDLDGADAKLVSWLLEAKGWQHAEKAYAELHNGGVPSAEVLSKLAEQPGGDQALDDLILNLPADTPAKVLSAAIKARFGFDIKRFVDMNADERNLTGLTAKDANQKDPELVAMYTLLSQIPSKRIKGKIKELVDFDFTDGGGVYYGGKEKKIYVHAGAIGTGAGGTQPLGRDEEVVPKGEEVQEDCKPIPGPPMKKADHTLLHETAHAEDDGIKFMESRWGQPEFGNWRKESPESIAKVAAAHFRYDEDWIQDTLEDAGTKPPSKTPKAPKGVKPDDWSKRREDVLLWCQSIRAANNPWWKGAICSRIQIGGRVYHEAYDDGRWRSYDYAARGRGISGYQFRAPAEWFAELYAAYFGGKLKDSHPAMSWLKQFQPIKN